MSYYAGNLAGDFQSSSSSPASASSDVNAVTWGVFPNKEIISPTIIEAVSFRAWLDEAFNIWDEWRRVYRVGSPTEVLLRDIRDRYWLVNVISHTYTDERALWDVLLDD